MVNYIEEDIPIRYPDRAATFLRNSNYLQQFDGNTFIDLEEQENNINKEKVEENKMINENTLNDFFKNDRGLITDANDFKDKIKTNGTIFLYEKMLIII